MPDPRIIAIFGLLISQSTVLSETGNEKPKGTVIAVGGGRLPVRILDRFIELAGGEDARVLVIPQASEKPDAGTGGKAMFEDRGLRNVMILDLSNRDEALLAIEDSSAIWISGGSQGLLMKRLRTVNGAVDAIRKRYHSGAVVGGTSAGAAVMSDVMIAGDNLPLDRGLGLWPEVIVDQHFVARKRMQRSFDAVMANPKKVGVGIGEGTAVIVTNGGFEVIGERTVTVIDAREAERSAAGKKGAENWRGIKIHSLREGETWQPELP